MDERRVGLWPNLARFERYMEAESAMPSGELKRSKSDRMIAGVCGGLARWLDWDPTAVRLLYVLASIGSFGFPGLTVYIILALVMPADEQGL
jgi:phage shock protein C